jgi:multiple sugar transport system permease protein
MPWLLNKVNFAQPAKNYFSTGMRRRKFFGDLLIWTILVAVGITMFFPLLWMASTSFKTEQELYILPPPIFPKGLSWENYVEGFLHLPYFQMLFNSIFVAVVVTLGRVVTSTFAGFAFARLRFPGRNVIFLLYLGVLMVPFPVTMVPLYLLVREFHLLDTLTAVILPSFVSAFNTFLCRQFMLGLPSELEDAARIDGANPPLIYWHVILPLSGPVIAAVVVFSFLTSWNSFIWPLLVVSSPENMTIPIGIAMVASSRSSYGGFVPWNTMMAIATASALPVILIYMFAQRQFVEGIAMTGIKG